MSTDRSASMLARLLNRSLSKGKNHNLLLSRFAIEGRGATASRCRPLPAASY